MRRLLEFTIGFLLASVANVCGQEIAPESQPQPNIPARIIDENTGLRNAIYNLSAIDYIPFSLSIDQRTSYSDNVQLLPQGLVLPGIPSRGDIYSATNFAGSSKVFLGEQLFFANAGYGLTRYVRDSQLNANNDFLDAGVNWKLTPRCSGDLVAAKVRFQSSILDPTSPGQVNTVSTKSADERARCQVSGHISAILDSGWGLISNSLPSFALANRLQRYIRGGLEYEVADLNTLGLQATFIDRNFTDRSPLAAPGLADVIEQTNYELIYRRLFAPNIEFKANIGLADIIGRYTSPIPPIPPTASRFGLIYATSLHYAATPKISFDLLASRSIDAPAAGGSDLLISEIQSLSLSYGFSPVLSFSGIISRVVTNNTTLTPIISTAPTTPLLFLNSTTIGGTVSSSYVVSPFVNATASYSYTAREGGGSRATANVFMVGLSYKGHDFFLDGLSGRPTPP